MFICVSRHASTPKTPRLKDRRPRRGGIKLIAQALTL
jgi:hypothetical protein